MNDNFKICNHCGCANDIRAQFCSMCGAPLNSASSQTQRSQPVQSSQPNPIFKTHSVKTNGTKRPFPKKLVAIAAVVAVIAVAIIVATSSTSNQFKQAFKNHDYSQVQSLYYNSLDRGDYDKVNSYYKILNEEFSKSYDRLNEYSFDEEQIKEKGSELLYDYLTEEFGRDFEDFYDFIDYIFPDDYLPEWERFLDLAESKEHYLCGVRKLGNNSFDDATYDSDSVNSLTGAIYDFDSVDENDSLYDDAKQKISDCIASYVELATKEADKTLEEGDIGGALDILSSIKKYLENNGIASEDIENKIKETTDMYSKKYYDKAEEVFKNKNLEAALGNLEAAMELSPENAEYKKRYDTYKSYKPFALYDEENIMNVINNGTYINYNQDTRSNNNIEMNHSVIWTVNNAVDSSIDLTYDLDGKYDVVKGTAFLDDHDKTSLGNGWFEIYGDGKMLYESQKITGDTLPKDFLVNVKDVQVLKITLYATYAGYYKSGYFGINNLIAQKNFPEGKLKEQNTTEN